MTPLILFAKLPIPGQVKTRLQTHCNAEQAARIAEILLEETLKKAAKYWPGPVILALWPHTKHTFIDELKDKYNFELIQQAQGDLGDKMFAALETWGYPAAVMGCDVPHLPGKELEAAYHYLQQGENVIGPTDDGGYYLMGLQQSSADLFADIYWGTDSVFKQTLQKADAASITFPLLSQQYDIDTWEDWQKASGDLGQ